MNLIVITDLNGGIGVRGDLLANIPEDLQFFKEMTTDSVCIMGRKTFDSIIKRNGRPLPNRLSVVLTSNPMEYHSIFEGDESVVFTDDILKLIYTAKSDEYNKVFVCGGSEVYKELIPFVDTAYVSTIMYDFEDVDAYFPIEVLEKEFKGKPIGRIEGELNGFDVNITKYTRIKEINQ